MIASRIAELSAADYAAELLTYDAGRNIVGTIGSAVIDASFLMEIDKDRATLQNPFFLGTKTVQNE